MPFYERETFFKNRLNALLKPIVGKLSGKNAPQIKLNDNFARSLGSKENALESNSRYCPNCGHHLPFNIEYVDNNIAIVGDVYSGKSHYIAALIQQLQERRVPPELGLTCRSQS